MECRRHIEKIYLLRITRMYIENKAHSIVSDVMTNACRVRPQPNINRLLSLIQVIALTNSPVDGDDCHRIGTSSGSSSEFFIEPMLSFISTLLRQLNLSHRQNAMNNYAGFHKSIYCS